MFYRISIFVVGVIWRFWFSLKLNGLEHIPKSGGYILASNHCSSVDPMIVAQGVRKGKIRFMAKAELFDIPVLGIVIRWLGAFPVSRGAGDMSAIETAIHSIENGKILGLFPEGTRSKDGTLQRFKSGLALIAQKTGAGILPVTITYTDGKKFRSQVVVNYGEFIPFSNLCLTHTPSGDPNPRELKEATRMLHGVMEKLKEQNLPESFQLQQNQGPLHG